MTQNTIKNNFGDPQIKTAAPAGKQPNASNKTGNGRSITNQPLAQYAEDILGKPAFQTIEKVDVVIDPNNVMFSQLIKRIHNEIERVATAVVKPGEIYIDQETVGKYLRTILVMRVNSVNGTLDYSYRRLPELLVHPFFAMIVDQIGQVRDAEFGLDFFPVINLDYELSPESMVAVSDQLFLLERAGLMSIGIAVWKDSTGTLEFMSLQHLDGVVRGTRISHTVYGFFAAMFTTMAVYENVGLIPKVVYGYDQTYNTYLNSIFNRC